MLQLNQDMHGFRIVSIASVFAGGEQSGAVILGRRESDGELVVALVHQQDIDSIYPAENWGQGYYFQQQPDDTALNSRAAEAATRKFLQHSGLEHFAAPAR